MRAKQSCERLMSLAEQMANAREDATVLGEIKQRRRIAELLAQSCRQMSEHLAEVAEYVEEITD